jgi:hypothetical protein
MHDIVAISTLFFPRDYAHFDAPFVVFVVRAKIQWCRLAKKELAKIGVSQRQ